jgi:peptide-methionine (S)-S-oxide reductase
MREVASPELLDIFWASHNSTARPFARQYASIIFYHNEEQRQLALESRDREAARKGKEIYTEIVPFAKFYLAEDYHQKYYLQLRLSVMPDLETVYPTTEQLVDSTLAARINGYLAGDMSMEELQVELSRLPLTPDERAAAGDIVSELGGQLDPYCESPSDAPEN